MVARRQIAKVFGYWLAVVALSFGEAAADTSENTKAIVPDFTAATFEGRITIDSPYFPLDVGYWAIIRGTGSNSEGAASAEESRLFYGGPGRIILGVQTVVQRDLAFVDGLLVEDTYDYYAQDADGNVWYMGEDVTNFVYDGEGDLIGTNDESAWIAGEDGAQPGWMMPAAPFEGLAYFQETAAGSGALDEAVVWKTGETIEVNGILFHDVLVTFETTQLDPTAREFKYYAPGVGLIRVDEDLDPNLTNPKLVFEIDTDFGAGSGG